MKKDYKKDYKKDHSMDANSKGIFSEFRKNVLRYNIITILLTLILIISAVYILTANYLAISNNLYLEKVIEKDMEKHYRESLVKEGLFETVTAEIVEDQNSSAIFGESAVKVEESTLYPETLHPDGSKGEVYIQEPAQQEPAQQESSQPSLQEPSLQEPSLQEPSLQEPSLQEPSLQEPSLQEPSLQEPSLQGSVLQELEPNVDKFASERKLFTLSPDPGGLRALGSAVIMVDEDFDIIKIFNARGFPDISEMSETVKRGIDSTKTKQTISIDGEKYSVLVDKGEDGTYFIGLMNVQRDTALLQMLLVVCILIAIICLIFGVYLSLSLTKNAMRPMESAWQQQQQFISDAAHELKTPISVIKANSELLKLNEDQTIASQMKWVGYIQQHSERMSKLIDSLLYISSYNSQGDTIMKANVDLSEIVNDCCMQFEALFFEADIDFDYDTEEGIKLDTDSDKINQLLFILFDNAVKYADKNGKAIVKLTKKKNTAKLTLSNDVKNGESIDVKKIFDRFFRDDYARERNNGGGGYGLGLSIARILADELGVLLDVRMQGKNRIEFSVEWEFKHKQSRTS